MILLSSSWNICDSPDSKAYINILIFIIIVCTVINIGIIIIIVNAMSSIKIHVMFNITIIISSRIILINITHINFVVIITMLLLCYYNYDYLH